MKMNNLGINMKRNFLVIFTVSALTLLFVFTGNAQTNSNNSNVNEKKSEKKQNDRVITIKSKTPPDKSVFSRCLEDKKNAQLRIKLKVTFHSSGKITAAEIIEPSGCEFFDKECLRISKKIKFKPEIKNGEPVTITKSIEYNAYIY